MIFGLKNKKPLSESSRNGKLKSVRIKRHKDKNGGHPHIILEDFEDKHVSVGLSSSAKKGKKSNSPNYKLEINPLGDGQISYLRRQGTVARRQEYSIKEKKGVMTDKDYAQAQKYGNQAKEKYIKRKSNDVLNAKKHKPDFK